MQTPLTDLAVKNLAAPERGQRTYLDRSIAGFGVRVSQGGTKTFTLMYGPAPTAADYRAVSDHLTLASATESPRDPRGKDARYPSGDTPHKLRTGIRALHQTLSRQKPA